MNGKKQNQKLEEFLIEWDKSHTFHHRQFNDIEELVNLKHNQGITISCGIPTYNEEKTIGKIIKTIRKNLMKKYPLLDELAVIDSGSSDKTVDVALNKGADVYIADQYLTNHGPHRGKGENLWKSLYLLKGDIIVWIDADIKNIHPSFVYGLVGALLHNESLGYVKAFYDRPLNIEKFKSKKDGGRVTECTVRPLFNLLYPKLSYIRQPCSGEYAGRRQILEQLNFPVGYFIETSHLIEIEKRFGLDIIGQVDLEERIHRNQRTIDLGKMAYGILAGVLSKKRNFRHMIKKIGPIYRLPQRDNEIPFKDFTIDDTIRPPIITIPEYQEKFYPGISSLSIRSISLGQHHILSNGNLVKFLKNLESKYKAIIEEYQKPFSSKELIYNN